MHVGEMADTEEVAKRLRELGETIRIRAPAVLDGKRRWASLAT